MLSLHTQWFTLERAAQPLSPHSKAVVSARLAVSTASLVAEAQVEIDSTVWNRLIISYLQALRL